MMSRRKLALLLVSLKSFSMSGTTRQGLFLWLFMSVTFVQLLNVRQFRMVLVQNDDTNNMEDKLLFGPAKVLSNTTTTAVSTEASSHNTTSDNNNNNNNHQKIPSFFSSLWDYGVGPSTTNSSHTEDDTTVLKISNGYKQNQSTIWDNNNNNSTVDVPEWIQEYFAWHKEQRALMNKDNWEQPKNFRYLIVTCFKGKKCGGVTDRLRPILFYLRLAHESQRLLLIYWERPFALEEFLVPPHDGLDWRVPSYIAHKLRNDPDPLWFQLIHPRKGVQASASIEDLTERVSQQKICIVTAQYQSWHYGELYYNEKLLPGEPEAKTVFRHVWNAFFTPVPPITSMINQSLQDLQLTPGDFATAHIRALYAVKERDVDKIAAIVYNAMNCVSNLRPGGPFLVASDSTVALELAQDYGQQHNVTVVSPNHTRQPLHLGLHDESDTSVTPADFYNIFVDLYLIASTRCVVTGRGGFGHWGELLGYNATCNIWHDGFKKETCQWKDVAAR